jgi:hypothetical protein
VSAALLTMLAASAIPTLDAVYAEARRHDRAAFRFAPPGDARLTRLRALAADVFRALEPGAPPRELRERAAAEGLELGLARDAAGDVWVLREGEGRREGTGLYAFRPGGAPVCVQAPHTFFDEGTGPIALAVFADLRAGCLFVNTVHRYAPSSGGEHLADVAHAERTAFRAVTRGMLESVRWPIVQLHGFGPRGDVGRDVAAVVSDGASARREGAPAARLREALAKRLAPARVLLHGVDTGVLGGTTNVIGADAHRAGGAFLHVELSAAARRRLFDGGAGPLSAALAEALGGLP